MDEIQRIYLGLAAILLLLNGLLPQDSYSSVQGLPVWTTHKNPSGELILVEPGTHRRDIEPRTKYDCHLEPGIVLIKDRPCKFGIPNPLPWGLTYDPNTASAAELQQIIGIGPKTAESIVNYRNDYGYFSDMSQLENVRGIGAVKSKRLRPHLAIQPRSVSSICPLDSNHDK